jgi:hypothetical protein
MIYYPQGFYYIYRAGREIATGQYDAMAADNYNSQMSKEDRIENLTTDLISWIEKTIKIKVTD